MIRNYYIYILASKRNGTLYIGVTNNIEKRIYEHKNNLVKGYTSKYRVYHLVYFEQTDNVSEAISREKQLKKWNRKWKLELIENSNPNWNDLVNIWIPDQVGNDRQVGSPDPLDISRGRQVGNDTIYQAGGDIAGGDIAGGARKKLEKRLNKSIVSNKNYINYRQKKLN